MQLHMLSVTLRPPETPEPPSGRRVQEIAGGIPIVLVPNHFLLRAKQFDAYLDLSVEPLECLFNYEFVRRFNNFTTIDLQDEYFQASEQEKVEYASEMSAQVLAQLIRDSFKLCTNIKIGHQFLILQTDNGEMVIDMGEMTIRSRAGQPDGAGSSMKQQPTLEAQSGPLQDSALDVYDTYEIQLSNLNWYYKDYKTLQDFHLIDNYRAEAQVRVLKMIPNIHAFLQKYNALEFQSELPDLRLSLSSFVHKQLLSFLKNFEVSKEESQQAARRLKEQIERHATKQSSAKRFIDHLQTWQGCHVIFSGGYLYLYRDGKQLNYQHSLLIKNCQVAASRALESAIEIVHGPKVHQIQFESRKEADEWTQILRLKIEEYAAIKQIREMNDQEALEDARALEQPTALEQPRALEDAKAVGSDQRLGSGLPSPEVAQGSERAEEQRKEPARPGKKGKRPYKKFVIRCSMRNFHVEYSRDSREKLFEFDLFGMSLTKQQLIAESSTLEIMVQNLCITDFLYAYKNAAYQHILTSSGGALADSPLKPGSDPVFLVRIFTSASSKEVDLNFNRIFCNWKADSILALLEVFCLYQPQPVAPDSEKAAQPGMQKAEPQQPANDAPAVEQIVESEEFQAKMHNFDGSSNACVRAYQRKLIEYNAAEAVLLKLTIRVKEAQVALIHWQSHECLSELSIRDTEITRVVQERGAFLAGHARDMQIYDVTSYPFVTSSNVGGGKAGGQHTLIL